MKKKWRRILCGMLSLGLASTLVVEQALRSNASNEVLNAATSASADVAFKDVTGSIDTSALRESQLNDSVLKNTDTKPTYETRTVMVTLSGDSLAEAADTSVNSYLKTFTGQNTLSAIRKEQNDFLRALKQEGIAYTEEDRYETLLNAVAIEVNTKYVSKIKQMAGVESVVITTSYAEPKTIKTSATQEVFNATSVYKTGIYDSTTFTDVDGSENDFGEGTVVAILDTGLDYTHEAFQRQPDNPAWGKDTVTEKLNANNLRAEERTGGLETKDVYVSSKVPFAYDYADDDPDVYPSYSNHGTHVAGIIGGYNESGYTDKDGNDVTDSEFRGVVPDSQLVICKVFTDDLEDPELGGAQAEDIIAALEDCVMLEVDVINMSLGTSCGFSTTNDGDDEGEMLNAVYEAIADEGISLVCAASNDYSAGYGGVFGTNLKQNPDSSTVGSPSTFASALSVASISGQESPYMIGNKGTDKESFVFFEESRDENSNPFDFVNQMLGEETNGDGTYKVTEKEVEYVVIPGTGAMGHYSKAITDKFASNRKAGVPTIALVKRGDSTFQEKVQMAKRMGADAIVVYNNVAGLIRMNLGEIEENMRIPAISIDMDAGNALIDATRNANGSLPSLAVGKLTISRNTSAGPFMSEFSSWGPTHDLKLKPEITAHGGEITSTVPGGYGEQSGTSMASPNMAGVMAIIRNYIKNNPKTRALVTEEGVVNNVLVNRLANQLIMSTATTVRDQAGRPYSPRKQGAGLGSLDSVVNKTNAYLWVDDANIDFRPKLEVGDDPKKSGVISKEKLTFKVSNFGDSTLEFTTDHLFFTETVAADGLAIAEQAHLLDDVAAKWYVNDSSAELGNGEKITVEAGKTVTVSVELNLSQEELAYLGEKNFPNGMYLEGFLKLKSATNGQCDLSIPFLGFHGDWEGSAMLDYTAYEVAKDEADPSLEDTEKKQASVWATQPYSIYYNEKYILPMGGYVYLVDENDDPVYTDEKFNAISRYNNFYGEDSTENYLTTTGIKAVYAGLLRNARLVTYSLTNVETGETVFVDKEINRVGKAYAGGGQAVPGNVEVELYPEEYGLLANGQYRMDFTFYMNDPNIYTVFADDPNLPDDANPNNMRGEYSFTFTVDYDAPVLQDARVRYKTIKDSNGKEKQSIYLDLDVYDNHYAQAVMLCYPKTNSEGELVLQLATEYATPVRSQNKNGTTTVSIEVTDIYEKYGNQLYVQIDDYAVNSCLYQLDLDAMHAGQLPENDGFALAEGEENITLDIYETHKVSLVYEGNASIANFSWTSDSPNAAVKDGEIVGLQEGKATISVSNRKGGVHKINVTVTNKKKTLSEPSISFGDIKTAGEALTKAEGMVEVNPGQEFTLQLLTDPWYHPLTGLSVQWKSYDESIATVDQNGNVKTLKKGKVAIEAKIYRGSVPTMNVATVTLDVVDEFNVSNYVLNKYNGVGYSVDKNDGVLWIPTDMNIMYIGEDAFKDNDNVKAVVIPASVVQIQEGAFENCSALEEVYFVSTKHRETFVNGNKQVDQSIDWADCSLIHPAAFRNCKNLKKIDLANAKTITVAQDCFAGCTSLKEIVKMTNMGTMYHRAFMGCTSLENVDLTGTYVMGDNVFEGCTALKTIQTGKFTALGKEAFKDCTGLRGNITLNTPNIGDGAFTGCKNLTGVKLDSPAGETLEFDIGARAFENCGSIAYGFTVDFGDEIIRTIGKNAFTGSRIKKIAINDSFALDSLRLGGTSFKGVTVTLADGYDGSLYAEENGAIYTADKSKLLLMNTNISGSFEVPASVTEIGSYAFANSQLTTVTFADASKLTKIGEGAFYESRISSIDLSNTSLTEIPSYAFYMSWIASVNLPVTVKTVDDYAFAYTPIYTAYMPGVETLGDYVFANCSTIEKIITSDTQTAGAIVLSPTLTTFGEGVFYTCTFLKNATLPSLVKMGDYTFAYSRNLKTVIFGADATVTGNYTFAYTGIESFAFVDGQIEVGEGIFYGCSALKNVTLSSLTSKTLTVGGEETTVFHTVNAHAFNNCERLSTVTNLDKVVYIREQAFYNTALTTLQLAEAKEIGVGAFAAENDQLTKEATYTAVNMPKVEKIGAYAFLNGSETVVELPASVKEIGFGAFASSKNLLGFKVANGNENFVVMDADENGYGVLYRYIDKTAQTYEIVCYPAARVQTAIDGVKTYKIADGTLYVQSAAFMDLNDGALDGVVLSYSINAVGDSAFFNSGIKTYTFESVQAPVLETRYQENVALWIESVADAQSAAYYKGYYYTNFETYFYHFTEFGGEKSTLVLKYPTNGIGYDNYVYTTYFGTRTQTEVVKTDTTRDFIDTLENLPMDDIRAWATWDKNDTAKKEEVAACAETVKSLRATYDLLIKDEGQKAFVSDKATALKAAEDAIRNAKANFGIKAEIKEVEIDRDTFKTQYVVGEKFDISGMEITLVYEDGTRRDVMAEKLTVVAEYTKELELTDNYVKIRYTDEEGSYEFRVKIEVEIATEEPETPDTTTPEVEEETGMAWWLWVVIGGGVAVVGGGVVVTLLLLKKKSKKSTKVTETMDTAEIEETETMEEAEIEETEATEETETDK